MAPFFKGGKFDDALGIALIGFIVFGLSVAVISVVNWISTSRSSRRRMLYRALLGARLYMKTKARPAPWLLQNVASIDVSVMGAEKKPRSQRKGGSKKR